MFSITRPRGLAALAIRRCSVTGCGARAGAAAYPSRYAGRYLTYSGRYDPHEPLGLVVEERGCGPRVGGGQAGRSPQTSPFSRALGLLHSPPDAPKAPVFSRERAHPIEWALSSGLTKRKVSLDGTSARRILHLALPSKRVPLTKPVRVP